MPAARYRVCLPPRNKQDQISASRDFICREETEVSYLASRPRPVSPASERRADPGPALRSRAHGGDRASSPADSRPTYPVERSLLQADRLALSLRGALDRLAPLLARAATAFVRRAGVGRARRAGWGWPPGADPDGGGVDESPTGPAESDAAARGDLDSDAPGDDPADRSLVRIPVPAPLVAAFDEGVDLYRAVEGTQASVTSFVEALVAEALAGASLPEPPESFAVGSLPEPPDDSASDPARPDSTPSALFFGDFDRTALRRGPDITRVEAAFARATENWNHLPRSSPGSWALHLAGAGLARLDDLSRTAGSGGPADLDAQIRELLALEDDLERRLGRLLAEMAERGAPPPPPFGGAGHYAPAPLRPSRPLPGGRARGAASPPRRPPPPPPPCA